MSRQTELDKALERLVRRFPPKHPNRKAMREFERSRLRTNAAPSVQTNGYQDNRVTGEVDWDKQERIPVDRLVAVGGRRKKPDGSKNRKKDS